MNTTALQDKRVWLGGGALLALVAVAASWLLFIHPELSSASQLRSQAADTDTQNAALAAKNAHLAQLNRNIGGLRTKLAAALNSLPATSGLPQFTREASLFATRTGIHLTSLNVGAITAVGTATSPAPTDPAATAEAGAPAAAPSTDASTTTTSPTTTPTATAPTASTGGEYSIAITLISQGSLIHQLGFVKGLEAGPRRVLVTSTQLTAGSGARIASVDANATMTTQLTIFSAPMSTQQIHQLQKLLRAGS